MTRPTPPQTVTSDLIRGPSDDYRRAATFQRRMVAAANRASTGAAYMPLILALFVLLYLGESILIGLTTR